MNRDNKLQKLKDIIGSHRSAVIAFSGGVDSTFLAKVGKDVLGDRVLLITAQSSTYPEFERNEALELARRLDIKHRLVVSEEIDIPGFADNPPDRCYHCKKELFTLLVQIAQKENYAVVFDGSNADDTRDYRPGRRALRELGIVSPLCDAGLTKDDIRFFSRRFGLPTAAKPSFACLASRFPYGEKITREKLERAEITEKALRDFGFTQFRVRIHDRLARLEFIPEEMEKAWRMRGKIHAACKEAGFIFVSIDLQGYRTGAMNEALDLPAME